MNIRTVTGLLAAIVLLQPALAAADGGLGDPGPWMLRIGVANVDPTVDHNSDHLGAVPLTVRAESRVGATLNVDYRFSEYFSVDLLGSQPLTHQIDIALPGGKPTRLGSTRLLPPTLSLQFHPLGNRRLDPFVGVGVNRTFFFNEALNGPLAGNNFQLSNTWGFAAQIGLDAKLGRRWLVGADVRYIRIKPDASVNGTPIGEVRIHPLVYGVNLGYRF
ncbi:MAG: OmpW family protein [Gammaproteobacteria bacterium]|nr:OmpW family protein [Gammaproteobacteria bacterium]